MVINSKLECSKTLINKKTSKKLLFHLYLNSNEHDVIKICEKYQNKIIDKLLKYYVIVNSVYYKNDFIKTIFLPKRFDIIIKNGIAYFYLKGD